MSPAWSSACFRLAEATAAVEEVEEEAVKDLLGGEDTAAPNIYEEFELDDLLEGEEDHEQESAALYG